MRRPAGIPDMKDAYGIKNKNFSYFLQTYLS
jgi:hypothetical protein